MVTASRSFICIRPATYESEAEAEVLKGFLEARSGELENTVFVLLAPDGETPLTRGGRSPAMVYKNASEMAASMVRLAERYAAPSTERTPSLPLVADVRRGLNVAACDRRPLIVLAASTDEQLTQMLDQTAPAAWSESLIGRARWAATSRPADLETLDSRRPGLLVVAPHEYGLEGVVVARLPAYASSAQIDRALRDAYALIDPEPVDARSHVRGAARAGLEWESEVPVTDRRR